MLTVAVVVLGPPLGAGCTSSQDGLSVTVQAAPLPPTSRSLTTDLGYHVTLDRAYLSLSGVELKPCPSASRWRAWRAGVAWAHSTASPTRLAQSFVLGLSDTGEATEVGSLGPPPGRYCGLSVTVSPADQDARGLPDQAQVGLSLRMEGSYHQGDQVEVPLRVTGTLAADAVAPLSLGLGDGGASSVTVTMRLDSGRWFDGIDLAAADADEVARAVLTSVTGSLTVDIE